MTGQEGTTFGEKVAFEFWHLGKTQSWLRRETGLSQSAISLILRGKQSPSLEQGLKIAKALGVSLDYLIDSGQTEPHCGSQVTEDEQTLLTFYRALGITRDEAIRGMALMVPPPTKPRA